MSLQAMAGVFLTWSRNVLVKRSGI